MRQNGPFFCLFLLLESKIWPNPLKYQDPAIVFFTEVAEACHRMSMQCHSHSLSWEKTQLMWQNTKLEVNFKNKSLLNGSSRWMLQLRGCRRCAVEHRNELSSKLVKLVHSLFKIRNYTKNPNKYNQLSGRKPKQKVELRTGRVLNMLSEWQGQQSLVEGMMRKKRVWHDNRLMQNGHEPHFLQTQNRWLVHS